MLYKNNRNLQSPDLLSRTNIQRWQEHISENLSFFF